MPKCPKCGALYGTDDEFCPDCGEKVGAKEKELPAKAGFMYECPICHKPGISFWRKACLGPALPTTCKQCGRKVGVPYSSLLALLPFLAAILLILYVPSIVKGPILIIGIAAMFVIHMKFIPLVPKE